MSAPPVGGRDNPYKQPFFSHFENGVPYARLKAAGEMGRLAVRSVRLAFTPPFSWWRDAVQQASLGIRRALAPLIASHGVYLIGFGIILFGGIVHNLGLSDRHGGLMLVIWDREVGTWITAMIFAGIVGSAVTADLGSRRIREELDAMAVLGVEQTRALIVPRVVATTIAMPVLVIIAEFFVLLVDFFVVPHYFGYSNGVFFSSLKQLIVPSDLLLTLTLKNLVIGFFVGVVACYKGVSCGAGAESVGRAVNQTVVITYFGIWLFNSLFNFAYFTLFPDSVGFRG